MTRVEIEKSFKDLWKKRLIGIEYFDKEEISEDSCIKLLFSESYVLIIYTFWRMMDENKIIAMDTERYLLSDYNAPEKDYKNLPFDKCLLYNNLEFLKTKYINSIVKEICISDTKDLVIKFYNSLKIQGIINCRCNSYRYYSLFRGNQEILNMSIDWNIT